MADSLSRRDEPSQLNAISIVQSTWVKEIQESLNGDELVQQLIAKVVVGAMDSTDYIYANGTMRFKGKLYLVVAGFIAKKDC